MASKIIESLRGDLAALHKAGAISKVTMREFDAICPPPVREFSADDIKRLRQTLRFSQTVFAHHLHITAFTVRKWEQGQTRPAGPALKLLNVIADKGLSAPKKSAVAMPREPAASIVGFSRKIKTLIVSG